MTRLSVTEVRPGDRLATAVYDRSGRLLLDAGTRIAERHLKILRAWGVVEVEVTESEQPFTAPVSVPTATPERQKAVEGTLQKQFSHTDLSHPAMERLFRLALQRQLQTEEGGG